MIKIKNIRYLCNYCEEDQQSGKTDKAVQSRHCENEVKEMKSELCCIKSMLTDALDIIKQLNKIDNKIEEEKNVC